MSMESGFAEFIDLDFGRLMWEAFFTALVGFYMNCVEDTYGTDMVEPPEELPQQFQHDAWLAVRKATQRELFLIGGDPYFATISMILNMQVYIGQVWNGYDEATRREMVAAALEPPPTVH